MTTIFGFDARAEVWLTAPNADSVPGLDGGLSMDLPSLRAAATDWGQSVSRLPVVVLYPGSITDIVKMVGFCRSFGVSKTRRTVLQHGPQQ